MDHSITSAEDYIGCTMDKDQMSWPPKPPYSDNRCRELAEEGQIWMKWLLENHPNPVRATPTAANVARMAELDAGELRHVPTQRRRLEAKGCCVVPEIYIYIPYKYRYIIYTYIYIARSFQTSV